MIRRILHNWLWLLSALLWLSLAGHLACPVTAAPLPTVSGVGAQSLSALREHPKRTDRLPAARHDLIARRFRDALPSFTTATLPDALPSVCVVLLLFFFSLIAPAHLRRAAFLFSAPRGPPVLFF